MPAILAHWAVADEIAKFHINSNSFHLKYFVGNEEDRYHGISKYLYLGANGPDLPYFENADIMGKIMQIAGESKFSDLYHYNRQADFIIEFVRILKDIDSDSHFNRAMPYILGHLTHLVADSIMHPFVNRFAGAYHMQPVDDLHKNSELHQDSWMAQNYFNRPHIDDGDSWTDYLPDSSTELDNLFNTIDVAFTSTYGVSQGLDTLKDSYSNFHGLVDFVYDRALGPVPKHPDINLVNHHHVKESDLLPAGYKITPESKNILYYKLFKKTIFDKVQRSCQALISLYENGVSSESETYFRTEIKNWNMDTGYWIDVDLQDGELNITWKHTWCE